MTMRHRHQSKFQAILSLLISIIILFGTSSGCNLINIGSTDDVQSPIRPETQPASGVTLTLIAHTPAAIPPEEKILLEIFDDVTGLPDGHPLYEMARLDDRSFQASLPLVEGSVIKYRYRKLSESMHIEHTALGVVPFRLAHTALDSIITDTILAWDADHVPSVAGTLEGQLSDRTTGLPIPDMLVSIAGRVTFTDANGVYSLKKIQTGTHNVVFFALDGSFRTLQQHAVIATDLVTKTFLELDRAPLVEVTFSVTAPNDARGVPIYLAGNLRQGGASFSAADGTPQINPKRMPMLSNVSDRQYSLTLQLPAGSDLRYRFTLGDGYWNAERRSTDEPVVRQLIVPEDDLTLDLVIDTWRSTGFEPITFEVTLLPDTSPPDEKYIQFKLGDWFEPLPLWPIGENRYLFILFSPLRVTDVIEYRFCRNGNCEYGANQFNADQVNQVQPGSTAQTITVTLSEWDNWHTITEPAPIMAADIPEKDSLFSRSVALTPQVDSTSLIYAPSGIARLAEIGTDNITIQPEWFLSAQMPDPMPVIGQTPFACELETLVDSVHNQGMAASLFPQIQGAPSVDEWWRATAHSPDWWQSWFGAYQQFIMNYAQFAKEHDLQQLILGGKSVLPTFEGGLYLDGTPSDLPSGSDYFWRQIIADVRNIYPGKLIWATSVQVSADPLPQFIDLFDEILVIVDAPLAADSPASFEILSNSMQDVINNRIYPLYEVSQKPVQIAIGYPSVTGAVRGCWLIDQTCTNDGIFTELEVSRYPVNLSEQALIYNVSLPLLAEQPWIAGITINGYDPMLSLQGRSSSLNGKPAMDIVWYWFDGWERSAP